MRFYKKSPDPVSLFHLAKKKTYENQMAEGGGGGFAYPGIDRPRLNLALPH